MKRFLPLLLLLFASSSAWAVDKVIGVKMYALQDVEGLGLQAGTSPSQPNSAKLQIKLDDSTQYYGFGFPGKVWKIDQTIVAKGGSRVFVGTGVMRTDVGDTFSIHQHNPTKLYWGGGTVTFNGTSITGTTSGASATITVSGATVQDEDFLHTVEITGGTNFTAGVYHILAVNEGSNTWTLDRACSTGNGSALTGTKKGTVWRDQGYGNIYNGLNISGTAGWTGTPTPSARAAIGWQERTYVEDETTNNGKASMRDCSFSNLDVGILLGKGLANFDYDGDTSTFTPQQDYDGKADNNADHFRGDTLHFQGCKYGVVLRTTQSVANVLDNLIFHASPASGRQYALYVERGGKTTVRGVHFTSGFTNGPTLLRLGGAGGSTPATISGPIIIDDVHFDAPGKDLRLLEQDGIGNPTCEVTIKNVAINDTGVGTARTFDGTLITATASSGSRTITVGGSSGFTVADTDKCCLLRITGGTGFIPGYYSIKSVTTGAGGTLTLDRVCSNASASGMTGDMVAGYYEGPIVTVKDGVHLTLENVTPITPGMIKIDDSGGGTFSGSITIRDCGLEIGDDFKDHPQVVIDDTTTDGMPFRFEGNWTVRADREFCRDGIYLDNGHTDDDTGWQE
ncbi:MAG: hypothetical protein AB7G28_20750 [Pirellulales bacterium]